MKALILAAGYATRLWPLTKNTPKSLLDVRGKPIIEHIVKHIIEIKEVDGIFVVTNEKFAPEFEEWVAQNKFNIPVKIINDMTTSNDDRLGAIGDMEFSVKEAKIDDELLVIAGDNLFEYQLSKFHKFFKENKASVVAVKDMGSIEEVKDKFGVVEIDDGNKVMGFY